MIKQIISNYTKRYKNSLLKKAKNCFINDKKKKKLRLFN